MLASNYTKTRWKCRLHFKNVFMTTVFAEGVDAFTLHWYADHFLADTRGGSNGDGIRKDLHFNFTTILKLIRRLIFDAFRKSFIKKILDNAQCRLE